MSDITISAEQLRALLEAGSAGLDLSNADLSEIDLKELDLSGANLSWADMAESSLYRANLTKATLIGATLIEANLDEANLMEANLREANFADADMVGANLIHANLTKATLVDAVLAKSNLTGADLSRANLSGANLSGANLTDANLAEANLTEADLSGATLDGTDLTGADLTLATLIGAELRNVHLAGADMFGVKLDAVSREPEAAGESEGGEGGEAQFEIRISEALPVPAGLDVIGWATPVGDPDQRIRYRVSLGWSGHCLGVLTEYPQGWLNEMGQVDTCREAEWRAVKEQVVRRVKHVQRAALAEVLRRIRDDASGLWPCCEHCEHPEAEHKYPCHACQVAAEDTKPCESVLMVGAVTAKCSLPAWHESPIHTSGENVWTSNGSSLRQRGEE